MTCLEFVFHCGVAFPIPETGTHIRGNMPNGKSPVSCQYKTPLLDLEPVSPRRSVIGERLEQGSSPSSMAQAICLAKTNLMIPSPNPVIDIAPSLIIGINPRPDQRGVSNSARQHDRNTSRRGACRYHDQIDPGPQPRLCRNEAIF